MPCACGGGAPSRAQVSAERLGVPARSRHAIFFPAFPLTIARTVECIKVSSTHRINAGRQETGTLWQPRYFDRASRTVKEYQEKVDYIHQNLVRAGLVKRAEDWLWSSAREYPGMMGTPVSTHPILRIDESSCRRTNKHAF
jgi:hypothetical protein